MPTEDKMALTGTFVRQVKATSEAGNKHADGGGMYLFVKGAGKYWRMDYRFLDKRKTLALGVYPDVSLAKARNGRDEARELLVDGIEPLRTVADFYERYRIMNRATHLPPLGYATGVAIFRLPQVLAIRLACATARVRFFGDHCNIVFFSKYSHVILKS